MIRTIAYAFINAMLTVLVVVPVAIVSFVVESFDQIIRARRHAATH